jgi:uncharacterized membrane protein YphA (DoxX/SURF4 family)
VSAPFAGWSFSVPLDRWLAKPQHALRIETLRIFAPLAILGFMASRVAHADEWIGDAGFRVPDLGHPDYRQPLYLPPIPSWAAWVLATLLVASGLSVALGFRPRRAAIVFAACTAFVAVSDRLAAFSVSKMAPMIGITIALSPCGRVLGIDAWLRKKKKRARPAPSGSIRFVQILLPVIYSGSGIAKMRGDWLQHSHVLWTHLHDSYQTAFTVTLANVLPASAWTVLQIVTLTFETGAPLWFGLSRTRLVGLAAGLGMHTMIGLMFGPVRWFAMLMMTLLVVAYLPDALYDRAWARLRGK